MRSFEKIVRDIATELKAAALRTEEKIIAEFPPLLIYHLLTGRKYCLTHDFDPPWDFSGQLFATSPDDKFNIDDYEKAGDFFEEYTGNKKASFISGMGFFYETYEAYYRDWMEEQYRSAHFNVLREWDDHEFLLLAKNIFEEDFSGQADDIDHHFLTADLCEEIEEFEDLSNLYACDLLLKLSEMDIKLIYKLGENQAKERIHHLRLEMEQRPAPID